MKTHKFDGVSLISGLIITGIGLIFLIANDPSDIVGTITKLGAWFWPVLFVVIGIAILIPVLMPKKEPEAIESETDQAP
ncbi:MAG: hypothetical protein V3S32_05510 [Acidimicrobiia bacterium]